MMKTSKQLLNEGDAFYKQGNYKEALRCFDEILKEDKNYMPAYRGHFECYNALGQHEETIQWCDKSLQVDPTYQFGLNHKALAFAALGKTTEALKCFDQAIELYPEWSLPYDGKGDCLMSINKTKEAIENYKKFLEYTPDDAVVVRKLAIALQKIGRENESKEFYDKAIGLKPHNALLLCGRGVLMNHLGFHKNGTDDFKIAYKAMLDGSYDAEFKPEQLTYIKGALASIVEVNDMSVKAENLIKNADQSKARVRKAATMLTQLQEQNDKVTTNIMTKASKNDMENSDDLLKELEKLKQQFAEELASVEKIAKGEVDEEDEESSSGNRTSCCSMF